MPRSKTPKHHRPIRVGDIVYVDMNLPRFRARVVEDRGRLGAGGRRLFRILPLTEYTEPHETVEVPADYLTPVRSTRAA